MKIIYQDESIQKRVYVNPSFDNTNRSLNLWMNEELYAKQGEEYVLLPEYLRLNYKALSISEGMYIDSETGLLTDENGENAVNGWQWIISTTKVQLGDSSPYVFALVAERIETFLTENLLW